LGEVVDSAVILPADGRIPTALTSGWSRRRDLKISRD
jgi:hypothetical protein